MKPEGITAPRESDLIDFPELARTANRYKWGVLGIAALSSAVAILVALSLTPTYRSTVTLLIEPRTQRVVQVQDVYDPGYGTDEYHATQVEVLRSRELAARVVDRLDLVSKRDQLFPPRSRPLEDVDLRQWLPFLPPAKPEPVGEEAAVQAREELLDELAKHVVVEPVWRTQLIRVHVEAVSPDLAAQIANTYGDIYIESGLQAKLDATRKATQWLTDKLSDIKGQLERSEAALQGFREQEQLVSVGGARSLTEEELVDYARRLREAQKRRSELQNAYEKIRQAGNDPRRLRDISTLLIDPLVSKANESVLEASEAVKQLEERYGAKHPQMATAQARLNTAQAALNEQLRVAAAGVKAEYEIAQQNERALEGQVASARGQIQRLDRKDYELSVLQREVQTNRQLYDTFLTRFKETDTAGSYENLAARVADPAVVAREPFKPERKKIVLVAGLCGLLAGILLALLRHLLSEEVRSAEELETLTRLPVFGVLPLVSGLFGKRQNLVQLFIDKPKTPFAEGVRSVRAAVQLADVDKRLKRLMVTSSVPREGKSSVASTLAIAFAAGEKVLLVDADLHLPTLHKVFNLPASTKARGLSQLLAGSASLDDCIYWHEKARLWLLPAGEPSDKPGELLSSERFAAVLAEAGKRFDRIVFDSPPCQAASDALLLAHHAQAVLFVVRSDSTSRRAVRNSLKRLQYAQAPLLGNIVNQVDTRRNPHYLEGYYYAYGYYG